MKNKNIVIWILAVTTTLSTTALATFWIFRPVVPDFRPNHPRNEMLDNTHNGGGRLMNSLNLSEEQEALFLNQREHHREKVTPLFDEIGMLRNELFSEIAKEKPDSNVIDSIITRITKIESTLQKEAVRHMLALKVFLDPVQTDSMLTFYSRIMTPFGKGRHQHRANHPCVKNH